MGKHGRMYGVHRTSAFGTQMTELRTPREAAKLLRVSIKTLNGHIRDGELRYINIGRGAKKPRKMLTDMDIDEFIQRRTRRNVPQCQSTSRKARPTSNTTSNGEVLAFTALQRERTGAKLKP